MKRPRLAILTGLGLNCEKESQHAFRKAGADAEFVHIHEFLKPKFDFHEGIFGTRSLEDYHGIFIVGGFSMADDWGAGALLAAKMNYNIGDELVDFVKQGKLVIGICNGFQVLVELGLLPGFEGDLKSRKVALLPNDIGNFRNIWIKLKAEPKGHFWTKGIDTIDLPIRHGEGKFFTSEANLKKLEDNGQVVFRYVDKEGNPAKQKYPFNPNGSLNDIAGMTNPEGNVLGMMPHFEAFNDPTNHPDWTLRKASGESLPKEGQGIRVARNAVEYCLEKII